ncbi:thiamine pyrophosphate-dependent enzyme [Chloroflexota bacterium]
MIKKMISETDALNTIARHQNDAAVIYTITSAAQWPETEDSKPALAFIGCLSKVSSFGLGLALARPDKKVMVLDGDGSLLMNLGSLVTIANMAPPNLIIFLFENTVWETSGGHSLPGAGRVKFVDFAIAAGFPKTWEFDVIAEFRKKIINILSEPGPTLVCLKVPKGGKRRPMGLRLPESLPIFKTALKNPSASDGLQS